MLHIKMGFWSILLAVRYFYNWDECIKNRYLPEWNAFIRYYDISGEGDTLVYLPALSFPAIANFLHVATHSKMSEHRAILIDNMGSGYSDHSELSGYTMEQHAQTVANILDHEDIKKSTVIGHSMGGTIVMLLALSWPDLVSKLIVGEGYITPGGGLPLGVLPRIQRINLSQRCFPALM